MVLNPALHSAAGNVGVIYSPNTGVGGSTREKQIMQQYPTAVPTTSASENERSSSQNSVMTAPVRQQQSRKKPVLKEQVNLMR